MSRAAIWTWAVALLLAVGIGAAVVHARAVRETTCATVGRTLRGAPLIPVTECAQARVEEDRTLLMAAVGAVVIVMGTALALSVQKPRRNADSGLPLQSSRQ